MTSSRKKKIIACCDGTWCGVSTGTNTNVKLIANCITGGDLHNERDSVIIRYFQGVGVVGSFEEYIINGAIADEIGKTCIDVYSFIVDNFDEDSEIWMFGLSRGAFTVRSVAGMINNWGILRRSGDYGMYDSIYRMYRDRDPEYSPKGKYAEKFKKKHCYDFKGPPIRFMGLFDTVGALGVPHINYGITLEYEFYDQIVSKQVENVCQALATHDRLSAFTPCFAKKGEGNDLPSIQQVWFPGEHYSIGRQRFVFPRNTGTWRERLLHFFSDKFNILGLNIEPLTEAYSDPVLNWMLASIQRVDINLLVWRDTTQVPPNYLEQRRTPFPIIPVVRKNAYDTLFRRWISRRSIFPFKRLLLIDRLLPMYGAIDCYSRNGRSDDSSFLSGSSGFNSRSYDNFLNINPDPGDVKWVS
jgi:hypothetical protein